MAKPRRWLDDDKALARLARDGQRFLEAHRGISRDMVLKGFPWPDAEYLFGHERWEITDGVDGRRWTLPRGTARPEVTQFPEVMALESRDILAASDGVMLAYRERGGSTDPAERRKAADFFRAIARAIDPPSGRGKPTDLHSAAIWLLYTQRVATNRKIRKRYRQAATPPPAALRPVIDVGNEWVTIDQAGWPTKEALSRLSVEVDVKEATLWHHIRGHRKYLRARKNPGQ